MPAHQRRGAILVDASTGNHAANAAINNARACRAAIGGLHGAANPTSVNVLIRIIEAITSTYLEGIAAVQVSYLNSDPPEGVDPI